MSGVGKNNKENRLVKLLLSVAGEKDSRLVTETEKLINRAHDFVVFNSSPSAAGILTRLCS
jgi:hypothetical protein